MSSCQCSTYQIICSKRCSYSATFNLFLHWKIIPLCSCHSGILTISQIKCCRLFMRQFGLETLEVEASSASISIYPFTKNPWKMSKMPINCWCHTCLPIYIWLLGSWDTTLWFRLHIEWFITTASFLSPFLFLFFVLPVLMHINILTIYCKL